MFVNVDLDRHSEHADAIRRHAVAFKRDGLTARLWLGDWRAIRDGREPEPPPLKTPNLGDPRPDPVRDRPCCDPPG
jgi:hypothetical protein